MRAVLFVLYGVILAGPAGAEPEKSLVERRFDFRGAQVDNLQLRPVGPGATNFLAPTADGMRIAVPALEGGADIGVAARFAIGGDFEITATYELVDVPKPDAGYGVGPSLHVRISSAGDDAATIGRLHRLAEGQVCSAHYATTPASAAPGTQRRHRVRLAASSAKSGKLRLVRSEGILRYLVADGEGDEFRLIDGVETTQGPIEEIRVVLARNGASTPAEVLLKEFTIRAEQVFEPTPWAGWGGRAAIVVLALAALGGGLWYWRKRRSARG